MAINERIYGKDHRSTINPLSNLAAAYFHLGNFDKATELHQRALLISDRVYGKDGVFSENLRMALYLTALKAKLAKLIALRQKGKTEELSKTPTGELTKKRTRRKEAMKKKNVATNPKKTTKKVAKAKAARKEDGMKQLEITKATRKITKTVARKKKKASTGKKPEKRIPTKALGKRRKAQETF